MSAAVVRYPSGSSPAWSSVGGGGSSSAAGRSWGTTSGARPREARDLGERSRDRRRLILLRLLWRSRRVLSARRRRRHFITWRGGGRTGLLHQEVDLDLPRLRVARGGRAGAPPCGRAQKREKERVGSGRQKERSRLASHWGPEPCPVTFEGAGLFPVHSRRLPHLRVARSARQGCPAALPMGPSQVAMAPSTDRFDDRREGLAVGGERVLDARGKRDGLTTRGGRGRSLRDRGGSA